MSTVYLGPPVGLRLKLSRARKHLRHLRRVLDGHVARHPPSWRRQVNAEGTHYLYSLIYEDAPDRVNFLADEAIHHMRTLLDHTLTALLETQGLDWREVQFPTLRQRPTTPKAIKAFDKAIGGLSGRGRDLIMELQPYQRGDDAESHPLWILSRLDNRFKHTSVHLFALNLKAPILPGMIQRPMPISGVRQNGDVFAAVPIGIDVEKGFEPQISIQVAFRVARIGIVDVGLDTLDEIHDFIRDELLRKILKGRLSPRLHPLQASPPSGEASTSEG